MSFDIVEFNLGQGIIQFLSILGVGIVFALVVSLIITLISNGFGGGIRLFRHNLVAFGRDFVSMSGTRMWSIADLTIKESIRKKALYAFVAFAILFMFAGWFLRGVNDRPDLQLKVLVSFMLTAISWLLLPVMLLLACWGLPTDIKARSLHTVITKPARRNEVMLGRVFGYTCVGTVVLLTLGVLGYVWINRQIPAEAQSGLVSRVPVYGTITFTDRFGNKSDDAGLNVGDVWDFRSYIEGGTLGRTFYHFKGLDVANFKRDYAPRKAEFEAKIEAAESEDDKAAIDMPAAMTLEYNFEAFRTHKGQIDQRLMSRLVLINPEDETVRVPLPPFEVKEFSKYAEDKLVRVPEVIVYRDEESSEQREANLFEDVMPKGDLIIEVSCIDPGQYLGMARPDLFIRTPDKPFASSYFRSIAGIWMQMFLVILLGVTASCFVKGPVATLLTFSFLIVGKVFRQLMNDLTVGDAYGGGPLESAYRMYNHLNMDTDMDAGAFETVIYAFDWVALRFLDLMRNLIPDFGQFRMVEYTANGFDVPWAASMLPGIAITLAYIIPCILLGYFSLKLREMEAK